MIDLKKEWSISFAGCGFMGIYYVGASSCILERFPRFVQDASKIYGASAGALMAAVLTIGIPLEKCCADLMFMAKEGRKHKLGPLHPAYNLMQIVQESLQRCLPEDAHVRASGKLCVSLTRVSDGKNQLVSEFDTREELIQITALCVIMGEEWDHHLFISVENTVYLDTFCESTKSGSHSLSTEQALVCSCFVPFYCGVIPPTYRGVHYVDGAVSDNLPQCHQRNTVTFSAYAGESDLCPRGSRLNFYEVRFNNVSIQVNSENMYRVTSTFFPPPPQAMAEICHNGYIDALRFLQENNLISTECPTRSLETDAPKPACCELKVTELAESNDNTQHSELIPPQDQHSWLDSQLIQHLPVNIKKALCEACRETPSTGGLLSHVTSYLPKKVTSYLQIPRTLPVESTYSVARRLVGWIPDVPREMSWLYDMAGDIYKQAWKDKREDYDSESSLRRSTSLPSGLNLLDQREEDINALPRSPGATLTSSFILPWNTHGDHMPLTPPPTPTVSPTSGFGEAATESPKNAGGGWGLGRAVDWIRNIASEQTSDVKKTDD